jgi:HAD superfamily hydrolase (TIGR01549 family)
MTLSGMIFDVDGTLVDTNRHHVEAWHRAFERLGFEVPVERIQSQIGKGGDKLVPSILGHDVEERCGDALRQTQKEEFLAIAKRKHFRIYPCVPDLFEALRERDIGTALATSSDQKQLQATLASAGVDLTRLADVVVTKSDAEESKPAPDIVVAAVEKLGLSAAECAMVGDTVFDGQACASAGVVFLGVLSGGTPLEELLEAGAVGVWRDVVHLLADLDRALEIASLAAAAAGPPSNPTAPGPY